MNNPTQETMRKAQDIRNKLPALRLADLLAAQKQLDLARRAAINTDAFYNAHHRATYIAAIAADYAIMAQGSPLRYFVKRITTARKRLNFWRKDSLTKPEHLQSTFRRYEDEIKTWQDRIDYYLEHN